MNQNENNPPMQTWIEPELEARVVAWVAGEASAFEAAELERLIGEKPELAIFKRRIEAVHGLVAEAADPEREPLRLSADRRAKLLQAIGSPENAAAAVPFVQPRPAGRRKPWSTRWWIPAVAACLTIGVFLLIQLTYQGGHYAAKDEMGFALPSAPPEDRTVARKIVAGREGRARQEVAKREMAYEAALAAQAKRAEERSRTKTDRASPAGSVPVQLPTLSIQVPQDEGYRASNTLAGTRMNTPLRDVGGAVTVVTSNFLKDMDSTNRDEAGALTYNPPPVVRGYISNGQSLSFGGAQGSGDRVGGVAGGKPVITGRFENIPPSSEVHFGAGGALGLPPVDTAIAVPAAPASTMGGALGSPGIQKDEVVKLSAFEVSAGHSQGYTSTSTLAGTRLNTSLDTLTAAKKEADEDDRKEPATRPPLPAPPEPMNEEENAAQAPVSTFSLHVSDVSFRLALAAVARDEDLDPASIRPEEFYNAFDYGDPAPAPSEKIACRIEQAAHPVLQQRNLVRIALKVAATGRGAGQPLRLTVLLDTSGSMEREDRAAAVRQAMAVLVSLLGPNDRLTLVGFARTPRLIAEQLPGDQAGQVLDLIARTPAEGGTNFEEALKLGGDLALRHREAAAQNRVVLLTDGAANLGNADPAQLSARVEALRQQGIAFDACGVGLDGIDDTMLEALTRKGDGRYYVLDTPESADAGFARQLAGAFRPAAENVKVQVRFNPARVGKYRLIGFEQHRLREEDFRNDAVDAAELAAEEGAVALYQVEALPQGEGELGEVYVRFRDPATGGILEHSWTITYDARAPAFDRATPPMQLAGTAALLAEKLRDSPLAGEFQLGDLAGVVTALRGHYAHESRVQELVTMYDQMRRLSGE